MPNAIKHLILGGARSGKSTFAETTVINYAKNSNSRLIYIATATGDDDEMRDRISQHQTQRKSQIDIKWLTIEAPLDIATAISDYNDSQYCILIDCLTLWLSNCLHKDCWLEQRESFINSLQNINATLVMVSNEVGSGIIPMGKLSRQFVDESGRLHQELAQYCHHVDLIVAGLPLKLK